MMDHSGVASNAGLLVVDPGAVGLVAPEQPLHAIARSHQVRAARLARDPAQPHWHAWVPDPEQLPEWKLARRVNDPSRLLFTCQAIWPDFSGYIPPHNCQYPAIVRCIGNCGLLLCRHHVDAQQEGKIDCALHKVDLYINGCELTLPDGTVLARFRAPLKVALLYNAVLAFREVYEYQDTSRLFDQSWRIPGHYRSYLHYYYPEAAHIMQIAKPARFQDPMPSQVIINWCLPLDFASASVTQSPVQSVSKDSETSTGIGSVGSHLLPSSSAEVGGSADAIVLPFQEEEAASLIEDPSQVDSDWKEWVERPATLLDEGTDFVKKWPVSEHDILTPLPWEHHCPSSIGHTIETAMLEHMAQGASLEGNFSQTFPVDL
jgi:hypothetical protein